MTVGFFITWHCTLGFFFFLTKHIFVFTSSRDLALEKRRVLVTVTHFTQVFALTKESQRTGPRPLAGKTS